MSSNTRTEICSGLSHGFAGDSDIKIDITEKQMFIHLHSNKAVIAIGAIFLNIFPLQLLTKTYFEHNFVKVGMFL